jgi:hypothetical protein
MYVVGKREDKNEGSSRLYLDEFDAVENLRHHTDALIGGLDTGAAQVTCSPRARMENGGRRASSGAGHIVPAHLATALCSGKKRMYTAHPRMAKGPMISDVEITTAMVIRMAAPMK